MITITITIYFGLLMFSTTEAYKALVVYPLPGKSHSILGDGVVRHLLNDGVEVTYLTCHEYKNPPENLRIIDISKNLKHTPSESVNLKVFLDEGFKLDNSLVTSLMTSFVTKTIENENVQKILNDPNEQFDVVVVEWMFTYVYAGLATVFNCPLVWVFSTDVNSDAVGLVDTALNPAISGTMLTEAIPPFTFYERVKELWVRIHKKYIDYVYTDPLEADLYETLLVPYIKKRGREPPKFYEVRYNASLVLGNSHASLGLALPLPQNYIPIGGYHLSQELKSLPTDLQEIMDNSKNGVIYFSMGSNLKSKDWPEKIKSDLLNMFGGLKQTILWKFEENLPNTTNNVHIIKWAPQESILAHPNIALFITHGGFLSTTEAICHKVPIIGIPVFGDQPNNVKKAVSKGFAIEVKLSYRIASDLRTAITKILSNSKYKETAKKLSYIYHDRLLKPGDELSHWVRHVVQTQGAVHLRSPSLHVPLYQQLYLDLAALLALVLTAALIMLRPVCSILCQKYVSKQKLN